MDPLFYSVAHVVAAFVLVAFTFQAFIAPQAEHRKRLMMYTGIASLVMVVGGFGLQAKLHTGFPPWLIVKIACWFGLTLLSGLAFRMPMFARPLSFAAIALIAIAVYCVYFKP